MLKLNLILALLIAFLSPLALIVTNYLSKNSHRYFKLSQKLQAEQNAFLTDRLNSMARLKQQDITALSFLKFQKANQSLKRAWHQALFFVSLSNPVNRVINNFIYIAICVVALYLLQLGSINLADLIAFLAYTNQFSKPFSDLSSVLTELQSAQAAYERLIAFCSNYEDEFYDDNSNKTKDLNAPKPNALLKAEDINFSYTADKQVLYDINFQLHEQQTIAIVGPSGSGKSTFINLLMRYYQPQSGTLFLDDQAASHISLASWRSNFALVLQESWIFSGTIRENLLFANPKATEQELLKACESARLKSFIEQLPDKLDTKLGNAGLSLSHGQKQLLALARLFLREAAIVLLDEAGSAIDCYNEVKIQKALKKLRKDKSAIIVAHRLATIYQADLILVMQAGKIVEAGTHQQLIQKQGLYKKLWQAQFPTSIQKQLQKA